MSDRRQLSAAASGAARAVGRRVILALSVCLLAGCATSRGLLAPAQDAPVRQVMLKVPFFPDNTDQCGPSALASVLEYWGQPVAPAVLKKEIYQAHLKGSLTVDMLLAAESRGLTAEMFNGDLARIKAELDAGHPVIAFVNAGYSFYPVGHYMVLTGYDDRLQCVFAHSGKKRDQRISYRKFDRQWEKNDRWVLLVLPPKL